jgi:hypothetical protein
MIKYFLSIIILSLWSIGVFAQVKAPGIKSIILIAVVKLEVKLILHYP